MQLSIARTDLARVLTATSKVVESRNTIPILSHLLLEADKDGLKVTGSDLDITATARCDADVTKAGSVCVDAKLIGDIARKAGDSLISLSLDGDKLTVKSGRSKFSLATLSPADFPVMNAGAFDAEFDIDLAALFAPVSFAISQDKTRPYLEGIYLHVVDNRAVAVATNGHRLARHVGQDVPAFPSVIIGQKAVSLISATKGVVHLSVSESLIRVTSQDFVLTSNLVDGMYPDYPRVIPVANELVVSADKGDILKAADRVATVSSERGSAVKLSVAPGAIALSVHSMVGDANDEVQAEYSGKPVYIGFNSVYLRDALQVFPDGPVVLALRDSGSPARITSPVYEALDVTLMPMRV